MRMLIKIIILALLSPQVSWAGIFLSKSEALELALGAGNEIEELSLFPDEKQISQIQSLARVKLDSELFTFYVGKKQGRILAYAAIESDIVRTKPETLMIVLNPQGELTAVHLLAFHEPPEYQAPQRWFDSLKNHRIADLELNQGIDGIAGATLSTRSVLNSVRKVMAFYQIMVNS